MGIFFGTFKPQIKTVPDGFVNPSSVTLTATSFNGAVINWYTSLTGGTPIMTGNTYTLTNVTSKLVYYIDATYDGRTTDQRTTVVADIISDISSNLNSTIKIYHSGLIYGWGRNTYGELGLNEKCIPKVIPTSILGTKKTFCKITGGFGHSLGIDKNGQVWSWGSNFSGILGDNSTLDKYTPVSILGNKKTFCQISGSQHSLGIDKNGQVWGWGFNYYGEIGDNSNVDKCTPVSILGNKKTFCKINTGPQHSLGIDKNGQVWSWGYNPSGELGINSVDTKLTPVSILGNKKTFCEIAAFGGVYYGNSSFGIDKNGQVWGWGYNYYGQLGNNSVVAKCTPVSILGTKKTFCQISGVEGWSVIAIDKNGQVWGWGYNNYGQLGNNSTVSKCTPVSILGTKKTFCKITSGLQFSLGISKNGETWSWGLNDYGQLGDSNTTNVLTPISVWGNKKTFCQITTGHYTSIGIDKNGQVWSWGSNVYGEIGDNTTTSKCTPVSILGNKKTFCQITGAYNHTLGIDKNGQIWSWGRNDYGQLGDNTKISKCTPVSILGNKKTFCQIDTGGQNTVNFGKHSSGIDKNGQIWTWGINPYGGLGDNSTTSRLTPVSILGNKKTFCSLSDGNFYMFGIDKNGQIWSWGYNAYGQLGDNSVVSRLTPVSILGTKKTFCKINSSNYTSLAIDKNGQVWGWGYNKCGNIGDNSVTCRSTPVSILGNKKTFCDIANSSNMSFGLDKNGQVWAWGGGILGNNQMTIISQKTPVSIHGAKKTFCKISGGYLFVVGIEKNGQVWGWSDNTYGQLGTYNNITSRLTPVRVCF